MYDSIQETATGSGLKIYIHDPDVTPVTTDHYFYATVGMKYDVTIAKGELKININSLHYFVHTLILGVNLRFRAS